MEFDADNPDQYQQEMERISRNDPKTCWVGSVAFGRAYANSYASPSRIPYSAVGDSPFGHRGYWKAGKFQAFAQRLTVEYQNSATGCE